MLFEISGVSEKAAFTVLNHVLTKLPLKTVIVKDD